MLAESGENQGNKEGSGCRLGELNVQSEGSGMPKHVSTLSYG